MDGDRARGTSALRQPYVHHGVPHVAAGHYVDDMTRTAERWQSRRKQVSFDYFTPLCDGWDRSLISLAAAQGTCTGEQP